MGRLGNLEDDVLHKHLDTLTALGLYTSSNDRSRIVFCRDSFDYPQLLEHEFVCEELGERFKRERKSFSPLCGFKNNVKIRESKTREFMIIWKQRHVYHAT